MLFLLLAASVTAYEVPTVDWVSMDGAFEALSTVGALRVTGVPGLDDARRELETDCEGVDATLNDGTRRTTVGALSAGGVTPLEFPCGLENLRELVDFTSRKLFSKVDKVTKTRMRPSYESLTELMHFGEHIEHFHTYYPTEEKELTLEMHTDAGLLISMVGQYGSKASIYLELPDGDIVEIDGDDGILYLVGEGMKSFLENNSELRPAPHAMKVFSKRTWYGKMWLPPADAIVALNDKTWSSYREMIRENVHNHEGLGCDGALPKGIIEGGGGVPMSRLLNSATAELCKTQNGNDGILCWAQCVDVTSLNCAADQVECVDSSTGAVLDGSKHCDSHSFDNCGPKCISTPTNSSSFLKEDGFCVGDGVTMYMDGFRSIFEENSPLCVNFWNTKWTLDTKFRFGWGVVGAFFVGSLVEALIALRRALFQHSKRRIISLFLLVMHFFQSVLGFLAMFLAMTYNVEIFCAVCLGATFGHLIFNFQQLPQANDPCCAAAQQSESLHHHRVSAKDETKDESLGGPSRLNFSMDEEANCCCGPPQQSSPDL